MCHGHTFRQGTFILIQLGLNCQIANKLLKIIHIHESIVKTTIIDGHSINQEFNGYTFMHPTIDFKRTCGQWFETNKASYEINCRFCLHLGN